MVWFDFSSWVMTKLKKRWQLPAVVVENVCGENTLKILEIDDM